MNKLKFMRTIFSLFVASVILMVSSCNNDSDNDSGSNVYDPAGEIAGTYIGNLEASNGSVKYGWNDALFIIRRSSAGSVNYDIYTSQLYPIQTGGYTTVGYSNGVYRLAALDHSGTVIDGVLNYTGKCSINGEKGHTFVFIGKREQ